MTLRVILDTNIYGKIIEDKIEDDIIEKIIIHKDDFIVYGMKLIRKELRQAPKHSKDKYNLRLALLKLYDAISKGKELELKPLASTLARLYFKEYRKNSGNFSWKEMSNDMLIVAEATISRLDIVVSDDNKTMLSGVAKKAYYSINKQHHFLTPDFIGYNDFKRKLL